MENYDGPTVRQICALELNKIPGNEVRQVRRLLMDINTHEKMYERQCNRLLLNVLDCGYIQGWRGVNIPLEDWAITYRELTEKRKFNPDLFTEIHLPIMI